ncbi:cryptochrome/photolyase family protein [Acetobacter conturbans]|uniref:Deoxyribodipyrimidine photo-lyase n=1 Tax=Acetobacter conturbans TaxID=1737472 RepID=A0ABX0JWT3_9PROT|nr:deoxyribodipyrimidine photo-lyase [Acetobacter conturbans]NHN87779.1 deoxyribodipyrimidine photo-lyase [Acetobacter conturbans]
MPAAAPALIWFREDFRLADNAALSAAAQDGLPLLCVFVLDEAALPGAAARWWLNGALRSLDASLREHGGCLHILRGGARELIPALARANGACTVHWNRRYDRTGREIDTDVKATLKASGIPAHSFGGALLYEPWTVRTRTNTPFQVFTPFWKAARQLGEPRPPLPVPAKLTFSRLPEAFQSSELSPQQCDLLPVSPDWASGLRDTWQPGEAPAQQALTTFVSDLLPDYASHRDHPAVPATSRLSPYLRFGHVTPGQLWHAIAQADAPAVDKDKFFAELGWREFAWSILFERPDVATRNLRPEFDALPWRTDPASLKAWGMGRTGYPLVDAGMRELWHTGWMHNRVRMVVASFLVKHLLIDWREGERWFTDTLVDHDPASNPMNWQWNAGTGVDAAPFFRIMNPILQSEKFDADGDYIRHWVPELARVPAAMIHAPWAADQQVLAACGVTLGRDYPHPVVDHRIARERALAAWKELRGA